MKILVPARKSMFHVFTSHQTKKEWKYGNQKYHEKALKRQNILFYARNISLVIISSQWDLYANLNSIYVKITI